jgi:hypothetical protein
MRKGFIGPIGDDLPSVISIMLALGLFFSGIAFALNAYNQKMDSLRLLQGSLEVSRVLTADVLLPADWASGQQAASIREKADNTARTYGLNYRVSYDSPSADCRQNSYRLTFFVTKYQSSGAIPAKLVMCFW